MATGSNSNNLFHLFPVVVVVVIVCVIGGLELEGVEVRVAMDDKDRTKVDALLPKQVRS